MSTVRRRALVTGGATGLGREIANALRADGYAVAVADIDEAGLNGAAEEGHAPIPLDLRSEAGIESGFVRTVEALGGLDLLVNNAGVTLHKPALEVGWAEWDAVQDVNVKGAFFLARAFARHLIGADRRGSVVSLASAHGIVGFADRSPYGISKAAIIHMTKMLAVEWAPYGIRVNAVAPGTVMTPSREALLADPAARERMLGRIPLGRFPTAEEVAGAVVYLASDLSGSITGHTLVLDGGTTVA